MSYNNEKVINFSEFRNYTSSSQLAILSHLLNLSHCDVKYNFQLKVEEITKFDIISNLPYEISEYVLSFLNLNSLLKCRQVCTKWKSLINSSFFLWLPYLEVFCINPLGFYEDNIKDILKKNSKSDNNAIDENNLVVIGEKLFNLTLKHYEGRDAETTWLETTDYTSGLKSNTYILGRHVLSNLSQQAGFHITIDQDCRGSNVVMALNEEVMAYAREDRHIVVKYVNFPHKKINVFEAHQCASIKFCGRYLITGGYDRLIYVWKWSVGKPVACMEGSMSPVYSLDLLDDMLISTDGKSVIIWSLTRFELLMKTPCFTNDIVEELCTVVTKNCKALNQHYDEPLLLTRSNHEIKVWTCDSNGFLTFLSKLKSEQPLISLHPFIQVSNDKVACSAQGGIMVWSLIDFTLVNFIKRTECMTCEMRNNSIFTRSGSCRVILLYYSKLLVLQYYVHENSFRLFSIQPNSKVSVSWKMPHNEIWPWSHRKPGIASLFTNIDNGFSATTKLHLFVATQGKKIYGMLFDAADFQNDVFLGDR